MKMRNKGKVHPFISASSSSSSTSSSSSPCTANKDDFSVLKLLPAAIFTLVSVLSLDDREVLAYMITRSLKSISNPSFIPAEEKKKSSSKLSFDDHGHKSPASFDCECFNCYTSFWFRWDSSPNRELINQAIEEFEEHLNNGEMLKNSVNGKNKRKEKIGRRKNDRVSRKNDRVSNNGEVHQTPAVESPQSHETLAVLSPESEVTAEVGNAEAESVGGEVKLVTENDVADSPPVVVVQSHKGLARKVLPDVMGIFNSRLWGLWSPNV